MDRAVKILKKPIILTLISIIMGLIVAGIILAIAGYPPFGSLEALISGIFSTPKYLSNVVIKSTPIIFTGLAVAFAFKTGLFNIGAEGQFIMGCVASTIVGMSFNLPMVIQIPLVILAGVLAGAIYGGIVGFLNAKFGIHEVISSIMLNWIALYFLNLICTMEIFKKPDTNGTYLVSESSMTMILGSWKKTGEGIAFLKDIPFFGEALLKTDVNIGFIIAILVAILLEILLRNTTKGFELRAVGYNKFAAESAGINIKKNIIHVMMISGGIAGLGAALYITGNSPHNISLLKAFENTGFNGLAVALIATSSPIGCIFSGLLFGGLLYGGQALQYQVGTPSEIINIVIGVIVFFVALTQMMPSVLDKFAKKVGGKNAR